MGKVTRKGGGIQRLRTGAKELSGVTGKVGFFESAKYPDGTPVAYVASIHEHGYAPGNIPPRPMMRPTIAEQSAQWSRDFGEGAKAVVVGRYSAAQVMDAVGMKAAGDVAKTISEIKSPPLAPATVDARRRRYADGKTTGNLTKPLVDTAVMVTSVTHITERKA